MAIKGLSPAYFCRQRAQISWKKWIQTTNPGLNLDLTGVAQPLALNHVWSRINQIQNLTLIRQKKEATRRDPFEIIEP
jgi:hypothetical protein